MRLPADSQPGAMLKLRVISKWWSGMVVPVLLLVLGSLRAPPARRAWQHHRLPGPLSAKVKQVRVRREWDVDSELQGGCQCQWQSQFLEVQW